MEKDRSKVKKTQSNNEQESQALIINRPEAMSSVRKNSELTIMTVSWFVWFFLCRPLIILFLWFAGYKFLYEHMIRLGGYKGLISFWKIYLSVIFTIFLMINGWNVYNDSIFSRINFWASAVGTRLVTLSNFGSPGRTAWLSSVAVAFAHPI